VADPGETGFAAGMHGEPAVDAGDRRLMVFSRNRLIKQLAALRIGDLDPRSVADRRHLAVGAGGVAVSNTENLMLDEPALMTRIGSRIIISLSVSTPYWCLTVERAKSGLDFSPSATCACLIGIKAAPCKWDSGSLRRVANSGCASGAASFFGHDLQLIHIKVRWANP
jgi:hypothetical protein